MRKIVVIAHNLRSTHNVGSLLRTAEGLGITKIYLTGYTPYPQKRNDDRLPHLAAKIDKQIDKTALDAAKLIPWEQTEDIESLISSLKSQGYVVAGLEQTPNSTDITKWHVPEKVALILGREVEGLEPEIQALCDECVEIPMFGKKESFNVVQAAAMIMYHCRFTD